MALDFHRLDTKEYLFRIDDEQYEFLAPIFETFRQWTGLVIDPYENTKLTVENAATLLRIIDRYVVQADLNKDKTRTTAILGFRGLLNYFVDQGVNFQLHGD